MKPETTTWEWGDAGNVLRFRSVDRALWREAMLPPAVVAEMTRLVAPYLPDLAAAGSEPPPITVPIDVRRYAALVAGLDRAQAWLGAEIDYGDPTDVNNAYRKRFWSELFLYYRRALCRIIASLDAKQWEQLNAEGLVWGKDLRLDPTPPYRDFGWDPFEEGDTLRFGPEPPRPGAAAGPPQWAEFSVSRKGYKERYGGDPVHHELPLSLGVEYAP
jgi:hypothetical protein